METLHFDSHQTWMMGNSLRSDILPALEAALRGIYIPHPVAWHFEHIDIPDHAKCGNVSL